MQRATAFAHGRPFVRHGPVHAVRRVDPARLAMRGNADHGQVVDAAQLRPDLGGGARHAGQQQVVLEEALVADALERGARIAEFQAFLVLDHLVQALAPGTVGHDASGELVHHHDLAVAHDVLLIEPVQVQHGQRAQDQLFAPERNAPGRGQGRAGQAQMLAPGLGERGPSMLPLDQVMFLAHARRQLHGLGGDGAAVLFLHARNDERRARLVDQHAVGLVHDGEAQAAQEQLADAPLAAAQPFQPQPVLVLVVVQHDQVAQIVEDQGLVRAVHDVGPIGPPPLGRIHFHTDPGHAQAQRLIQRRHDLRVALDQIIVGGDDMHRQPGQRRRGGRQRGGQRLALARVHLGHHALQHGPAAQQLHIEMRLAQRQPARLPHQREGARGAGLGDAIAAQVEGHLVGARAHAGQIQPGQPAGLAMHLRQDAAGAPQRLTPLARQPTQRRRAPGLQLVGMPLALPFGIERVGRQSSTNIHFSHIHEVERHNLAKPSRPGPHGSGYAGP